jgi:hypothetical protein
LYEIVIYLLGLYKWRKVNNYRAKSRRHKAKSYCGAAISESCPRVGRCYQRFLLRVLRFLRFIWPWCDVFAVCGKSFYTMCVNNQTFAWEFLVFWWITIMLSVDN